MNHDIFARSNSLTQRAFSILRVRIRNAQREMELAVLIFESNDVRSLGRFVIALPLLGAHGIFAQGHVVLFHNFVVG